MNWEEIYSGGFDFLIGVIAGIILLVFSEKIQQIEIRKRSHRKFKLGLEWVESKSYLIFLRLVGAGLILVCLGIGYLHLFSNQGSPGI